jgi:hypothetical protein
MWIPASSRAWMNKRGMLAAPHHALGHSVELDREEERATAFLLPQKRAGFCAEQTIQADMPPSLFHERPRAKMSG